MRALTLISVMLLALAACSPSPDDEGRTADDGDDVKPPSNEAAREILQGWFDDNPQCTPFFQMPHDVPVKSEYSHRQAQAFVDAGLLRREGEVSIADPSAGSGQRRVVRYAATARGQDQFRPGSGALVDLKTVICYGKRKIGAVKVGGLDALGDRVSVTYRYRLADIPSWARAPTILTFYPTFKKWLDREEEEP